jgi:hypothetical protein
MRKKIDKKVRVTPLRWEFVEIAKTLAANDKKISKMALALALAQMEFWQKVRKQKDLDGYLTEENQRLVSRSPEEIPKLHGWFYKSGSELDSDLHGSSSPRTMNRALKLLTEAGIFDSKPRPYLGKGKTFWYRLNLRILREMLHAIGADLKHWKPLLNQEVRVPALTPVGPPSQPDSTAA